MGINELSQIVVFLLDTEPFRTVMRVTLGLSIFLTIARRVMMLISDDQRTTRPGPLVVDEAGALLQKPVKPLEPRPGALVIYPAQNRVRLKKPVTCVHCGARAVYDACEYCGGYPLG